MKYRRLLLFLVSSALVTGAAVGLTACGSSDDGPSDGDGTDAPEPHSHNYAATEVLDCVRGDYTRYECDCGATYTEVSAEAPQGHVMVNDECTRCHAKATEGLEITINGSKATVTGLGTATGDEIIIPSTYHGAVVTVVSEEAFKSASSVKWLTVPASVTAIADGAFYDCDGLEKVWLSDGLEVIGDNAFEACDKLKEITLPATLKTLGEYSFASCPKLETFDIPAGVESVGVGFIAYCGGVKTVSVDAGNSTYKAAGNCIIEISSKRLLGAGIGAKIPDDDSVEEICDAAFASLTGIGELALPNSVKTLGNNIFAYSDIEGLTLNGDITEFNVNVLKGCQNLTWLNVSETNYKYDAVNNCIIDTAKKLLVKGSASSVIPDDGSVTEIGEKAFMGCAELTKIVIPRTVTKIGNYAFADTGLTAVTLPSSLDTATSKMDSAFKGCNSLKSVTIEEGITAIGQFMFSGCAGLTQIVIPDSVTEIGYSAFTNCSSLSCITLGKNLKTIGSGAFANCNSLFECYNLSDYITVTVGNENKEANGGLDGVVKYVHTGDDESSNLIFEGDFVFINNDGVYGLIGYTGESLDVVLPTSCKGNTYIIPDKAFADSAFKSLTINGGVTAIGEQAFSRSQLESVYIKAGALEIGKSAFSGCSSAKSLTILADSLTLGDNYSIRMVNLTELTLTNTELPAQTFENCTELTTVSLTNVTAADNSNMFAGCTALKTVTLSGSISGTNLFYSSTEIENLTITDCVLGAQVLSYGLYGTVTVTGESALGDYEFYASTVNNITIAESVTRIGYGAFASCNLNSAVIEHKKWILTDSEEGSAAIQLTVPNGEETATLIGYIGYYWEKAA